MYVLDQAGIRSVDMNGIVPFVECWERYYDYSNYDERVYFAELNIDSELTIQNITRLLRWKDPRMLTHPKTADGEPNPRVIRVLEQIGSINGLRNGRLTAEEFPNGYAKRLPEWNGLAAIPISHRVPYRMADRRSARIPLLLTAIQGTSA